MHIPRSSLLLVAITCSTLALAVLSGCSDKNHAPTASSSTTSAAAPASSMAQQAALPASGQAAPAAASAPAQNGTLVKGIYTWGPEVESLSICNTNKTYWLDGADAQLGPLQEIAMKKAEAANEAYQPVYVEVRVTDAGKATDGFAVDYDGVMRLESVALAQETDAPADCKLLETPDASASDAGAKTSSTSSGAR